MNRKQFISTTASATASAVFGTTTALGKSSTSVLDSTSLAEEQKHNIKRGVSFYSYQANIKNHSMSLEECIQESSDIGAMGLECIGQVIVKDYPNISDNWVKEWWEMMDKYGTTPVCYTNFHDQWLHKLRPMTTSENLEYQTREFQIARKLGFKKFRMLIGTPIELLEAAIPVAEKLGIWMGLELHYPAQLKGPQSQLIERIVKIAEKHPNEIGFVPDMGMFQHRLRPYDSDKQIEAGILTRDIVQYIEESVQNKTSKTEVEQRVSKMKPKPEDMNFFQSTYRFVETKQDPKDLLPIMKYCKHIHAKFWEMSKGKDYFDTQINYDEIIPVLIQGGYDGYLCSEYEGGGSMNCDDLNEVDEVRRQHVMLKRLLGE